MKEFDARTQLSDFQYKAMLQVIEAKGLTQAGYIRQLILKDIVASQDLVDQMSAIKERVISGS